MGKVISLVATIMCLSVSAMASTFSVKVVRNDSNGLVIQYKTIAHHSQMCAYETKVLSLVPATQSARGLISINASVRLGQMCLTATGPWSGTAHLTSGNGWLTSGYYKVFINSEYQGSLLISK